jgi:hypothetical protein
MIRPLMLGGMVFGKAFLDIFERFCVASLRSPANLEALRNNGAKIVLYTTREDAPRLAGILKGLLPYELHALPPAANEQVFEALGAVQYVLVKRAADEEGRAFHMLMPDQMYSERYFPNLFRLAEISAAYGPGDVLHNTLNARMSASGDLDAYRSDGALTVPAPALGAIAWKHIHDRHAGYLMNRAKVPTSMPLGQQMQLLHLWRARDRVMLFSPHNTPVYLTPRTAHCYPLPVLGTLDGQVQYMVANFVCPALEDDMAVICIEQEPLKAPPSPPVDWATFANYCWKEIGYQALHLQYFRKPTMELHAAVIEGAPTAEDVLERQGKIADGLEEWGAVKGLQEQERLWEEFIAERRKKRAGAAA